MYKNMVGEPVDEQVEAFCDSWTMDTEKQELMNNMHETMREYGVDANFIRFLDLWMQALGETQPALLAYLLYMTVRLLEMKRLLKPTGSIYYHCDPTASHYIKIIMDGIFGHKNFRNEVVWCKPTTMYQSKTRYVPQHDIVFFYTKGKKPIFNWEVVANPFSESTKKKYKHKDKDGRVFRLHGRNLNKSPIQNKDRYKYKMA